MLHATRETGFTLSKYARQHIIQCDIDSTKICDIMNIIMVKHCNVSVCGYNKLDDVYWGKKCNRGVCELDFQIVVKNLGHNNSNVVILTLSELTTNTSVSQSYTLSGTSGIVNTALLYPIHTRAMAIGGGTNGSAHTLFGKFQLYLK